METGFALDLYDSGTVFNLFCCIRMDDALKKEAGSGLFFIVVRRFLVARHCPWERKQRMSRDNRTGHLCAASGCPFHPKRSGRGGFKRL
jgi:hypothetical protein